MRSYSKDDRCPKCHHLKETVRVRLDRRIDYCQCTGECGCFVCITCNKIPCVCEKK